MNNVLQVKGFARASRSPRDGWWLHFSSVKSRAGRGLVTNVCIVCFEICIILCRQQEVATLLNCRAGTEALESSSLTVRRVGRIFLLFVQPLEDTRVSDGRNLVDCAPNIVVGILYS